MEDVIILVLAMLSFMTSYMILCTLQVRSKLPFVTHADYAVYLLLLSLAVALSMVGLIETIQYAVGGGS